MGLLDDLEEEFTRAAQEATNEHAEQVVREALEQRFPGLSEAEYEDYLSRIDPCGNPAVYMGFYLDSVEPGDGELICAMTTPDISEERGQMKFSSEVYYGVEAEAFVAEQARSHPDTNKCE